jgi:hypothetical protein
MRTYRNPPPPAPPPHLGRHMSCTSCSRLVPTMTGAPLELMRTAPLRPTCLHHSLDMLCCCLCLPALLLPLFLFPQALQRGMLDPGTGKIHTSLLEVANAIIAFCAGRLGASPPSMLMYSARLGSSDPGQRVAHGFQPSEQLVSCLVSAHWRYQSTDALGWHASTCAHWC